MSSTFVMLLVCSPNVDFRETDIQLQYSRQAIASRRNISRDSTGRKQPIHFALITMRPEGGTQLRGGVTAALGALEKTSLERQIHRWGCRRCLVVSAPKSSTSAFRR